MRTLAATCLLVSACTFEPGAFEGDGRGAGGGGAGGGTGSGSGSGDGTGSGSGTVVPRTCSWDDPELRLCIEFEDGRFSPMVSDASAAQLDVPAKDVQGAERFLNLSAKVGAAVLYADSNIVVPENMALDIGGPLSIDLWVNPMVYAYGDLVTNAGQYRLRLTQDRRILCELGGSQLSSYSNVTVSSLTWTHVGCAFDGRDVIVYVNGKMAGIKDVSGAPTGGMSGTRIGGNGTLTSTFAGGLDDIHIYAKNLSSSDMCQRATGQLACVPYTPPDGDGNSGQGSGPN